MTLFPKRNLAFLGKFNRINSISSKQNSLPRPTRPLKQKHCLGLLTSYTKVDFETWYVKLVGAFVYDELHESWVVFIQLCWLTWCLSWSSQHLPNCTLKFAFHRSDIFVRSVLDFLGVAQCKLSIALSNLLIRKQEHRVIWMLRVMQRLVQLFCVILIHVQLLCVHSHIHLQCFWSSTNIG